MTNSVFVKNRMKKWTASVVVCGVLGTGIFLGAGSLVYAENSPPQLYQEYPQPGEAQEFAGYAKEINEIQTRLAKGQPVERALHSKAHGCLQGTFKVLNTIPDDAKYGVLVPGAEYAVTGRFSNASGTPKADTKSDMRGFAMKLTGTPGVDAQDFLMTNGPVHFAKDAAEMMEFADAGSRGVLAMGGYFLKHPHAAVILLKDISHKVISMTTESYWSRVPFKIGPKAMKFNVTPCADDQATDKLLAPKKDSATYLTDDLRERAAMGPICFNFNLQVQKDAAEMMEFADAGSRGVLAMGGYFLKHPRAAVILLKDISHKVISMTTESYWSRVPFKIGPKAMKFNVTPCADDQATDKLLAPKKDSATYLTDDLRERAAMGPICFNFNLQFQKDAVKQPIEDASIEWKEEDTRSVTVAQVVFPAQTFDSTEQMQACNDMAFSPWHAHPDFRPIGNMNRARQAVYESSQWFRGAK